LHDVLIPLVQRPNKYWSRPLGPSLGKFITQWGSTGNGPGQFTGVKSLAVDAQGNVYVADVGNKRIQIFDGDGKFKSEFGNVGTPYTMCLTRGTTQYLYISHVGDDSGMDDATIYKVQLDGKVVGKFGSAGKLPKEFGIANCAASSFLSTDLCRQVRDKF